MNQVLVDKDVNSRMEHYRADGQIDECEIFDDATASEPVKVTGNLITG